MQLTQWDFFFPRWEEYMGLQKKIRVFLPEKNRYSMAKTIYCWFINMELTANRWFIDTKTHASSKIHIFSTSHHCLLALGSSRHCLSTRLEDHFKQWCHQWKAQKYGKLTFSIAALPLCISTDSIQGFPFPHLLANMCCLSF